VDGIQTWQTSTGGVSQVPEYMTLTDEIGNYGTGSNAWGTGSITNAALPDYYLIDYARVYESGPFITNQPQSQTVVAGFSANFEVSAAGTAPLSYQWRFNGTNLPATGTNFTRTNAQPGDAGSYSAVVTDIAGSSTSGVAMLTVLVHPVLGSPLLTNGIFSFQLTGNAGFNYAIEGTTNLLSSNWVPITTLSNANGLVSFADTNNSAYSFRAYRARLLP
jgi:hypothetical protein